MTAELKENEAMDGVRRAAWRLIDVEKRLPGGGQWTGIEFGVNYGKTCYTIKIEYDEVLNGIPDDEEAK